MGKDVQNWKTKLYARKEATKGIGEKNKKQDAVQFLGKNNYLDFFFRRSRCFQGADLGFKGKKEMEKIRRWS
jgi:hypothetical protein